MRKQPVARAGRPRHRRLGRSRPRGRPRWRRCAGARVVARRARNGDALAATVRRARAARRARRSRCRADVAVARRLPPRVERGGRPVRADRHVLRERDGDRLPARRASSRPTSCGGCSTSTSSVRCTLLGGAAAPDGGARHIRARQLRARLSRHPAAGGVLRLEGGRPRTFFESARVELRSTGSGVDVSLVLPGRDQHAPVRHARARSSASSRSRCRRSTSRSRLPRPCCTASSARCASCRSAGARRSCSGARSSRRAPAICVLLPNGWQGAARRRAEAGRLAGQSVRAAARRPRCARPLRRRPANSTVWTILCRLPPRLRSSAARGRAG